MKLTDETMRQLERENPRAVTCHGLLGRAFGQKRMWSKRDVHVDIMGNPQQEYYRREGEYPVPNKGTSVAKHGCMYVWTKRVILYKNRSDRVYPVTSGR